jgi:adenylate cyclase
MFRLKNDMMVANFLSNLIGVALVQTVIRGAGADVLVQELGLADPIVSWVNMVFTPFAFAFVFGMTLFYERPIRRYLNAESRQKPISQDFKLTVRRRVLNEPFVLIALDLSMWILSALLFPSLLWTLGSGWRVIQRAFVNSFATGLITVTIGFFLLEYVLQKRLVPHYFPEGRLYAIPKTMHIRIRTRLVALFLACNLIPLLSILNGVHRITGSHHDPDIVLNSLISVVSTNVMVFLFGGMFLTLLVNRNLTLPFREILETLQAVRDGMFEKKVRVTSNDEIGYTGDVINQMADGLKERDLIKDAFGKYVAREIRDEVLSGRVPLDGEKKDVTILFSDLRNFTPLTESNEPKLVIKIMNSYFKEMAQAIQDQGGLILQFIGDEIYAVFGAPISRRDHPSRAFRASLEMSRRLVMLNRGFVERGWPSLEHGIGIHSGEALAANIGSPDRLSYLLVGDTVNLASRLQELTKEFGIEVILSSATHSRLTTSDLSGAEIRQLPPTRVKGIGDPVEILSVVQAT